MRAQPLKHTGKAAHAGRRVRCRAFLVLMVVLLGALLAKVVGLLAVIIVGTSACLCFAAFTFLFFRDPTPCMPPNHDGIVAPAHGRVDFVGPWNEPDFMGGNCQRISILLSLFDVHVQNAPLAGVVHCLRYQAGRFRPALPRSYAPRNENLFIGLQSRENPDDRVGVRLIAGFLARRIVGWVEKGESVERGQRLGMIQFGSRCDLYLPPHFCVIAKLGDRVRGGETIVVHLNRSSRQPHRENATEDTHHAPLSV